MPRIKPKKTTEKNPNEIIEEPKKKVAPAAADQVATNEPEVDAEPEQRIESLDDAKQMFSDGIDRLKESSADEIRDVIGKGVNKLFRKFERFVDGK